MSYFDHACQPYQDLLTLYNFQCFFQLSLLSFRFVLEGFVCKCFLMKPPNMFFITLTTITIILRHKDI